MAVTLYSTTYCPYAWAVRIVLHEKRIPFEVREVDLKNKSEEFMRLSPTGKVPLLCHDERRLSESTVINEYLEEIAPDPNLLGETPFERACVRTAVVEVNWTRTQPLARLAAMLFYERERHDDERVRRQVRQWYAYLDELDRHFSEASWFVLDRFTLADVCLYATVSVSQGFGLRVGDRRGLCSWLDRMNERDSVRRSAPSSPVAQM